MPPEVGASATVAHEVTDADTAVALGSGDVPVLGTPRVVALCEAATVAAVAASLAEGETTVGTAVRLEHLAAVAVGGRVEARAVLEGVEGRRLAFAVAVTSDHGPVATGEVARVVVGRERFLGGVVGGPARG